tara:strand:- start:12010 stop:12183 length:174 start_codon:yes stop_codon:yes gene_type:complete
MSGINLIAVYNEPASVNELDVMDDVELGSVTHPCMVCGLEVDLDLLFMGCCVSCRRF